MKNKDKIWEIIITADTSQKQFSILFKQITMQNKIWI